MDHDGTKRCYLVHVPESYNENNEVSLIIALHGGLGSAKNIEEQSGLASFSEEKGFIACFPNALNKTWNAGGCCGKAVKKNIDDVGFISKLIDELLMRYTINPNKVYVTGMSNGGFMAYRLACELSHKIAAIAPVAGSMNVSSCVPVEPVSVLHFHSYEDSNVPYGGGIGDGVSDHYNPPIDSVLQAWAIKNGCNDNANLIYDGDDYDHFVWGSCTDSTSVELFITHDGGHSWPMGEKPLKRSDQPSQFIDANALMWDFFQQHAKNE